MSIHHCKRCGQKAEEIGNPVLLAKGAIIQWVKCLGCGLFDGIITAPKGEAFAPSGNPYLAEPSITLNDIASALGIKIDYERYLSEQ
jgi:hypothetical protein